MQIFPNGTMTYVLPAALQQEEQASFSEQDTQEQERKSVICTITALSEEGYQNGVFRSCRFSVTCNLEDVGIEFNNVQNVSLSHDIKGDLGTFHIQHIEFYTITQTVEVRLYARFMPNGTLEVIAKTQGGLDPETGYPVPASVAYGDPIPCQIVPVRRDNLARDSHGEHYVNASYKVYIAQRPFPDERIRLKGRDGGVIGEFSVISAEQLDAVCETVITV